MEEGPRSRKPAKIKPETEYSDTCTGLYILWYSTLERTVRREVRQAELYHSIDNQGKPYSDTLQETYALYIYTGGSEITDMSVQVFC
jgi:hypothetical protein